MAKQSWKPGNMLYPVPVVMVSCGLPDEKPNIITIHLFTSITATLTHSAS